MSIPAQVRDAVVDAYYPRALAAPDAARARAQSAYTIASAIAAGLIAAGAFADFGSRPGLVQVLGFASLGGWLAAAALFMVAVSSPLKSMACPQESADEFVREALRMAAEERQRVDTWQGAARWVAAGAGALTLGTFVSVVAMPVDDDVVVEVSLTEAGRDSLADLCGQPIDGLDGTLALDSLDDEFVVVEAAKDACRDEPVELRLPRDHVSGIAAR